MNPAIIWFLVRYGAVAALGFGACYWAVVVPVRADLTEQIATIKADDAAANAALIKEAKAVQEANDREKDTISTTYLAQRQRDAASVADLGARNKLLNGAIDAFSKSVHDSGLPPGQCTAGGDDRARLLGQLLEEGNGLLLEGADSARAAAAQIRALETTLGAKP